MLKLRDILTPDPITVSPEMSVCEAMELLVQQHVSGVPVVSGGRVVGVVSSKDLLALAGGGDTEAVPLTERAVREAMTESIVALPPDADVQQASELMERAAVHRLPVMDGDRLVGIVSALDVARAVAEHRMTAPRYVFNPRGKPDERDDLDDQRAP
jgi:CBS domain-containing protein